MICKLLCQLTEVLNSATISKAAIILRVRILSVMKSLVLFTSSFCHLSMRCDILLHPVNAKAFLRK